MYLFLYLCACAFLSYVHNLTKQILYIGLSARKTLALRGKVCNSLVTTFL
nr:MAG TPA: hypothetical protein [Microviridae sp.]